MEQKQLRNEVNNEALSKSIYLFYGDEDFLKKYYAEKIKSQTVKDLEDFNFYLFDGKLSNIESINSTVESPPIMSEKKMILFKNTSVFKGADERLKGFLSDIFDNTPEYLVIVFLENEIDKRNALFKKVSKIGGAVEFPYPDDTNIANWIIRECLNKKIDISKNDAFYLIEHSNKGMNAVKNEMNKLFAYCTKSGKIQRADIDSVVTKSLESRVFTMIDNVMEKNASKVMELIDGLVTLKEPYVRIEILTMQTFEKLLKVKIYQKKPISQAALAQKLGVSPYFMPKYVKGANAFTEDELIEILSSFALMDYNIRNGLGNEWGSFRDFMLKWVNK